MTLIDSMGITSVTYILSDRIRYDNQRLFICVFFLRSPVKIRKIEKRGERMSGYRIKPWEELTISDDYMFKLIMSRKRICKLRRAR